MKQKSVINISPAGLSHRLKPARCAALAVEKITAEAEKIAVDLPVFSSTLPIRR